MRPLAIAASLALAAGPLLAQATAYSSGCPGLGPTPAISHTGGLLPGDVATVTLRGVPPLAPNLLLVGTQDTTPTGQPLAIPLDDVDGMQPGCTLDTDVLFWFPGQADASGEVALSFTVPDGLGPQLNLQFAVLESSAPLSLVMSPALQLAIPLVVTPDAEALDLPATAVGEPGDPLLLTLHNDTPAPITVQALELVDGPTDAFSVQALASLPADLAPGATLGVQLSASPAAPGVFDGTLVVRHADLPESFADPEIRLRCVGLGAPGADLLLDAGAADAFVDGVGQTWAPDGGFDAGALGASASPVAGTPSPELYQSWRAGEQVAWSAPLPNGSYQLTLHAAELEQTAPGARVFDILVEGQLLVGGVDLVTAVGNGQAWQTTLPVELTDGRLDLVLQASAGEALLAAVEVRSQAPTLLVTPSTHVFGALAWNEQAELTLDVTNIGTAPLELDTLVFHMHTGAGEDFELSLDGQTYTGDPDLGGHHEVALPAQLDLAPGQHVEAELRWSPSQAGPSMLQLQWHGNFESTVTSYSGVGGGPGHPFLVPQISDPGPLVDWDGQGSRPVLLDGSDSSTLQPGQSLVDWRWRIDQTFSLSGPAVVAGLAVGRHEVQLEVRDDQQPAQSASTRRVVEVHTTAEVPGVLARLWDTTPADPAGLLLAPPTQAPWTELRSDLHIPAGPTVAGSPFHGQTLVQLNATVELPAGVHEFTTQGGTSSVLLLDGSPTAGPSALPAGAYELDVRFAIDDTSDLPLQVSISTDDNPPTSVAATWLSHDQDDLPPALNALSSSAGSQHGGDALTLQGAGFFPSHELMVNWGPLQLSGPILDVDEGQRIHLVTPPLPPGPIAVSVETPAGVSASLAFDVQGLEPTVEFLEAQTLQLPTSTTSAAWASDGRLFVGLLDGGLLALSFDDDWNLLASELFAGVSGLADSDVLALAADPFAPPFPVRISVAHTSLAAQGGVTPSTPVPYPGAVSVLEGPSFDAPQALVEGLPTSNAFHGPTALLYDNAGDLLIAVGSNTNAGVSDPAFGGLPESPLSAALLEARTSAADFDGTITYVDSTSGAPDADQRHGEQVDQSGGDVSVRAAGLRNPVDLTLTDAGEVLALDRGAVAGLGEASTSAGSTSGTQASSADELVRLEQGHYVGHANRSRGRTDPRQDVWHDHLAPDLPDVFQQALATFAGPVGGLVEYDARSFADALRGDLLVQLVAGDLLRVELGADGVTPVAVSTLVPGFGARQLLRGPGGALLGLDLSGRLQILTPAHTLSGGFAVYDVFPDRAPATGGTPFVLGGLGFGSLATTSVRFGNQPAVLSAVSDTRIHGLVPAGLPSVTPLDIEVDVAGDTRVLDGAFRSLFVPAGNEPARWSFGAELPVGLSEISVGIVDGVAYVVGDGDDGTFAYDFAADTWTSGLAPRPFPGDHQPCEVWGGRVYLLGGLGAGSDGKVQIYDPATDSWSLGATMPWNAGSSSSAVIGGLIYVAGGIKNNSSTSNRIAAYDPASDSWGPFLASMPLPRNHAASATDGERLWVFGGRGPGSGDTNVLANGFADVQVYDPLLDAWDSSSFPGSELVPLPIGRGGTGKAVWYHDHFWVLGGETLDGPGATPDNVYARVDVYDPSAHSWRLETPLPTPRHGIFPLRFENRIHVFAGGWKASTSFTTAHEILRLD